MNKQRLTKPTCTFTRGRHRVFKDGRWKPAVYELSQKGSYLDGDPTPPYIPTCPHTTGNNISPGVNVFPRIVFRGGQKQESDMLTETPTKHVVISQTWGLQMGFSNFKVICPRKMDAVLN